MTGELQEKCAIAAVSIDPETWEHETADIGVNAASMVATQLFAQQHRGPRGTGIVGITHEGDFVDRRTDGMVKDAYPKKHLRRLAGTVAVGHNRYATDGDKGCVPQPVIDPHIGLAMATNGNLPQTTLLREHLQRHSIRTNSLIDVELMTHAVAHNIRSGMPLPASIEEAYPYFRGAFSSVALLGRESSAPEMGVFRDRRGIRPLSLGKFPGGLAVASETCGLDVIGAEYVRDVEPGELIMISGNEFESKQIAEPDPKLDIFEMIYFASPSSKLYGQRVNEVRYRSGVQLAIEHGENIKDGENTIVVPVPSTSVPAAEGFAQTLGLNLRHGIIKNPYSPRSFLEESQYLRQLALELKHSPLTEVFAGKDVVLVDDSIVRLNTMPLLAQYAAQSANSVTVMVASPPVQWPDFYGIDMPSQRELAAANMTREEMRQKIGCHYLGFLPLSRLIEATQVPREKFNLACFTGEYPIGIGSRKDQLYTPVPWTEID